MKRLLGIGLLLAIVIAALSSHGKSGPSTTAASKETAPAVASTTQARPATHAVHASYTRCDQNISAGPHTTCGFADNVFRAFARQVSNEGSDPANYAVQATSPATGHTYSMACRTSAETTECSGAGTARVHFPLWAAEVYYHPSPSSPENAPTYEGEEPGVEEPEETESNTPEPGSECTSGTYVNAAGNTVCSPEEAPTAPAGATAECEDGTYSFSESRSGTCSHHGGVATWLN
jgi:hypothetical protein